MASFQGIFNALDINGDLFATWMKRKDELEAERYQPYADLLLDSVVWPELSAKSDEILASLKEKCATATGPSDLNVPIWSFSYVPDFPKNGGVYDGYAGVARLEEIQRNNWHHTMTVKEQEDDDEVLQQISLLNVVKKTDFCNQLAVRFGTNFWVTTRSAVTWETDPSGASWMRHTHSLMLNYFPWGLPEHYQKRHTAFVAKFATRDRRVLSQTEYLIFSGYEGNAVTYGAVDLRWRPVCCPCCNPEDDE